MSAKATKIDPIKQVDLRFGELDADLAVAIPALVSVRKQHKSVITKSLIRDGLRTATDLPENIKAKFA